MCLVLSRCIEKLLKEKIVLVSTNNLQLLHQTNYVVALREVGLLRLILPLGQH